MVDNEFTFGVLFIKNRVIEREEEILYVEDVDRRKKIKCKGTYVK